MEFCTVGVTVGVTAPGTRSKSRESGLGRRCVSKQTHGVNGGWGSGGGYSTVFSGSGLIHRYIFRSRRTRGLRAVFTKIQSPVAPGQTSKERKHMFPSKGEDAG